LLVVEVVKRVNLRIFDPETNTLSEKIEGFNNIIFSIKELGNGVALVGGENGELRIFNPQAKTLSEKIKGFNNWVETIQELSNGTVLVG